MTVNQSSNGLATTLEIEGTLDALSAAELRPVIEALAAADRVHLTVELSHLDTIDASGVGAIVSIYKRVHAHRGEVRIQGLAGQPLQIFKLLKLDTLLRAA